MGESTGDRTPRAAVPPPRLEVGGLVSGGRYELLEAHGGVAGQAFWKARDKRLGREVALTFVDPLPGEEPPGSATGVLDRTIALTGVYSDGLARVLDVIRGRAGGIVVTEWVPGRPLAEVAREPDPDSAVGAVWGLSDAATRAETQGMVLGLDSPDRLRVSEDGRAILAFPGVSAASDSQADIRGLGAVLYALLTGRWPLGLPEGSERFEPIGGRPAPAPGVKSDDDNADPAPADTAAAADSGTGSPADPTVVGTGVAAESAVLAMRSLDGTSVSSAATVRAMITDRVGGPVHPATAAAGAAAAGGDGAGAGAGNGTRGEPVAATTSAATFADDARSGPTDERPFEPYSEPDETTVKRRWQIMAGTGAVAVVAIAALGAWMLGGLSGDRDATPLSQQLDAIERAAERSRAAEASEAAEAQQSAAETSEPAPETEDAAEPTTPVEVSTAIAWQPADSAGTAENSSSAPNVLDGDESTSWSTDTYRSQIGDGASAFKPGIGLMIELDGEQETSRVVVHSEDDLTFEIRSADEESPTSLDATTLLGEGTTSDGSGTVTLDEPAESGYVLVWITRLDQAGTQAYNGEVTEVELTR